MSANSFGKIFRITSFGESHGEGIGVVIDGCPSNITIDEKLLSNDLQRRRPGQSSITTQRNENESYQILSGIFEGKTTGTPICIFVKNKDHRSEDYSHIKDVFRPSHADYTYEKKYGHRDYRGGGRSSARETLARVIAGAIAKSILNTLGIKINAFVSQIGNIAMTDPYDLPIAYKESNIVRCPDDIMAEKMIALVETIRTNKDTIGGRVSCVIRGVPAGLGAPVFDKIQADLAKAMMSINAAKGFEMGSGFSSILMKGSEHNDIFTLNENNQITTLTNNSGGVQGGITNGMNINFSVAFKPVSTIMLSQNSISTKNEKIIIDGKGRHDPCVVPRAVPIVEAMAACVLLDHYLLSKTVRLTI